MNTSHSAQKIIVCIKAIGGLSLSTLDFGSLQRWRDCAHNARGHLILQIEHVRQLTIEAVRPEMSASRSVNELTGDAHSVCRLAHAAFEHVAHAQLAPDLLQVHGSALVRE